MIENARNVIGLFDYYELRARIIPAILIFSPLLLCSVSMAYSISDSVAWATGGGLVTLAVAYVLSFVVRSLGRKVETVLWEKWNGPPSTRFMRWQDSFFSPEVKRLYHDAIRAEFGIQLKDETEEHEDPPEADRLIMDAFRQVRSFVRIEDGKGVWNAHNAEYGFLRNIFGSRFLWLTLALLGTILCGYLFYITGIGVTVVSVIINGFLALLALLCCSLHTQMIEFIKQVADRYAESTWGSFITIHRRRSKRGSISAQQPGKHT